MTRVAAPMASSRTPAMVSGHGVARRRAVLPQQTTVAFPFTVTEVVAMGRAPWAGTAFADDDESAVAEALADASVRELAGRRFATLSGGERARVALARVLAQRTGTLLLDEPTVALDLRHQDLVLTVAAARAAATLTSVYEREIEVLTHPQTRPSRPRTFCQCPHA
jgi:iron complex transport system ATP-binding protein